MRQSTSALLTIVSGRMSAGQQQACRSVRASGSTAPEPGQSQPGTDSGGVRPCFGPGHAVHLRQCLCVPGMPGCCSYCIPGL